MLPTLSIPPNTPSGIYSAVVGCEAFYTGLAKSSFNSKIVSGSALLTVEVTSASFDYVTEKVANFQLSNLQKGTMYSVSPVPYTKGYNICPATKHERVDSSLMLQFTGNSGTPMYVSFGLPKYLTIPGFSDRLPILFSHDSYISGELTRGNFWFNPTIVNQFLIGATGTADVRLGCIITVPSNVREGTYSGNVTAYILENNGTTSISSKTMRIRAEVKQLSLQQNQTTALFQLEQNFPNPFNSETEFRFTLHENQHVNLSVYNIIGEEVASLISEFLPAGNHIRHWDTPPDLPSGIYYFRLQVNEFVETKKLLLMR